MDFTRSNDIQMYRKPAPEEELQMLVPQLAGVYKEMFDQYRRMCRVNYELRLTTMPDSANRMQQQSRELRARMDIKRNEITAAWIASKSSRPPVESLDRLSCSTE